MVKILAVLVDGAELCAGAKKGRRIFFLTPCSVAAELSQLGVTGVELPEFANSTRLWLKEPQRQRSQLRLLPHLVHNHRIWVGATLNQTTMCQ